MFSVSRTTVALATAAASLAIVGCDELDSLPVSQVVEGAEFSYTIPAGTESQAAYTLEQTVPVDDIQAQLTALGIDNFTLESVELKDVKFALVNGAGLDATDAAYVALDDIESIDISFEEVSASGEEVAAAILLASLAGGDYDVTDLATSLEVVTGVNILEFLERREVTVRTEVKLKEAIRLEEPLTVDVEFDYEVKAKVEAGE